MNDSRRLSGLAAGLLLSCAAAHAQSGVQVYGVVDMYVGKKQLASASGLSQTVADSGGMTTSQWGMRGTEDLGGGLKASFEMSGFFRADTGDTGRFTNDAMFSRTTYVGLQGNWGLLRLGRITTPNFVSTIRLNPFGDSVALNPISLHTYIGGQPMDAAIASGGAAGISDSSFSNAVAYTSPNVAGFVGALSYGIGEASGGANRKVGYSLTYGSGPLLVSLSGEDVNQPTLPAPPVVPAGNQKQGQSTWQLGASYDLGSVKLFAQHSRTDIDLPASAERSFRTTQLGAAVPVGKGRVLASVAQTRKSETALANVRRTTWALGYDHDLSKRTDVYAVFMKDSVTNLQRGTTLVAGIRHRF